MNVARASRSSVNASRASRDGRRQALELGAGLFAGGALLTAVATLAPHPGQVDVPGAWATVALSSATALVFWLGRDRLPWWTLSLGIAIGTLLITFGIYVNGERDGGPAALNELYYVWPVVFAAYYFSARATALQVALVAACYAGVLLIVDPGPIGVTRWLILVTMAAGVGTLICRLQARVHELVERLSDTARRDPLTGLLNRRGFEERLGGDLARAARAGRPLAVLVGDVDEFKAVNDRLGHPAGDAALLRVASVLDDVSRRGDTVARIGGEEFVMIAPDTDGDRAYALAERARAAVEREFGDDPMRLTASFGVSAYPEHGATPDALVEAADRGLYAAKRAGRNRTLRGELAIGVQRSARMGTAKEWSPVES